MSDSEDKKIIKSDIKKYASLEAVSRSDGGQILIKTVKDDITSYLGKACNNYLEIPEVSLRTLLGVLNDRINLYKTLTNAPKNKRGATKALEELLKQEPEEQEV